jgi:hypothetical protein
LTSEILLGLEPVEAVGESDTAGDRVGDGEESSSGDHSG